MTETTFSMHQLLSSAIFIFISELVVPRIPKRPKYLDAEASKDVTKKKFQKSDLLDGSFSTAIFSMGWRVLYQRFGKVSMKTSKGLFAKTQAAEAACRGAKTRALPKGPIHEGFCDNKVAFLLWDSLVIKDLSPVFRSCAHRNWWQRDVQVPWPAEFSVSDLVYYSPVLQQPEGFIDFGAKFISISTAQVEDRSASWEAQQTLGAENFLAWFFSWSLEL